MSQASRLPQVLFSFMFRFFMAADPRSAASFRSLDEAITEDSERLMTFGKRGMVGRWVEVALS